MRRPEAAERGLALQAGHQVGGEGDLLLGGAQHELAGMEDQRVLADVDQLGEVLLVLADVDHPAGVVPEEPEVLVDVEIHRRGLDAAVVEGVDHDVAGVERLTDGAVGENHAGQTIVVCAHRDPTWSNRVQSRAVGPLPAIGTAGPSEIRPARERAGTRLQPMVA